MRGEALGNYEKYGHRNLRWELPAREALEAWARLRARGAREVLETAGWFADRSRVGNDDQVIAWKAARRAMDLGCDDALIQYIFARLSYDECMVDSEKSIKAWLAVATAMHASNYPALLRARAYARAGYYIANQNHNRASELPGVEHLIDEALGLIPAVTQECRDDPNRASTLYHLAALLIDAYKELPSSGPQVAQQLAASKVMAAMAKVPDNRLAMKLVAADVLYTEAWWYRGPTRAATDVPADDWADFETRINQTRRTLLEALELSPTCPEVPRAMICVESIQDGGRERMEKWFEQAMRANSDEYAACAAKLEYLDPRWHGSEAEMLAFGRACQRTGNAEGRLPFILLFDVHFRLARLSLTPLTYLEKSYFARPYVWQDIQSVYEPCLARNPNSHFDKTWYAMLATLGGHYDVANRLFNELGDNYWKSLSYINLDAAWCRETARRGRPAPEPMRGNRRGGGGGFRMGPPGQRTS
jgi:hypothetical protein